MQMSKLLTKTQMSSDDINLVITMIDQESANSVYRRCAEEFGFRIARVDGNAYSIAKELSPVFGYSRPDHVSRVLKLNQCKTIAITGLPHSGVSLVKEALGLSERDYSTQLIDYQGFLTIALEGQGEQCDKVRQYLLAMEQIGRTNAVVYEETGLDTSDLSEIAPYMNDPTVKTMLESQKTMRELVKLRIGQIETNKKVAQLESSVEYTQRLVGDQLPITSEEEHVLNQKRDKLIELMTTNGMNKKQAYPWFYNRIKSRFHIGIYRGMERTKFPLAIDWIDNLIAKEQAKLSQLELPSPV